MLLLAFSFLLLAISMIGIGRTYLIEDYRRGMMTTATEVAHTASAVARGNSLSDWTMSMVISSISGSTGDHIFISDEINLFAGTLREFDRSGDLRYRMIITAHSV